MAIINVPQSGGNFWDNMTQSMLQSMIQAQRLEQQERGMDLEERRVKVQESDARRAADLQTAQQQAGVGILNFLLQQNPQLQQSIQQAFPQTTIDPVAAGDATQRDISAPFNIQRLPEGAALPLAQGLQQARATEASISKTEADARRAQVAADIEEATKDATIEVGQMQPELANAQLEDLRTITRGRELSNAYQQLLNTRDPQRVNTARALFETGQITWGQARETAGLPEDTIPDNTVYVQPGGTQASAESIKNIGFARMMQVSHGIINQLNEQGVRLSFLPSLQRQSQSATFDALVNMVSGSEQERLVNAQRMFGDAYRFSLSGQQSSDREALRMLNAIAEQVGDSEETIAQKRALREVMINVTRLKAGGALDPVQGARMGLNAAKNTGNEETIKVFEEILQETIEEQQGEGISSAPTDSANIMSRIKNLDDIINQGLLP